MKDFLRHNGAWLLIIALLLSILIGLTSAFMGGNADPFSNVVNTVTAPVRSGIAAAADWAEGVYSYVFHYSELQEKMDELEKENADLRKQIRQGEAASQENEQLRELLNLQAKREDFVFESAKVTARSTDNWRSTLTLSKGSNAGVEKGDCVITETGLLVGVVNEVGTNYAIVNTLIDTGTEMGGIITRTNAAGVLEGDFTLMSQGKLKLNYLPEGAQLVSGDEVVTSGKGDVFPSGLVVGQVEGVFTDPSGQSRYAVVTPLAKLDSLIEVFVIKDFTIVE